MLFGMRRDAEKIPTINLTAFDLAKAFHAALVANDPEAYIDEFDPSERVIIDGSFDLVRVSSLALDVLRKVPR